MTLSDAIHYFTEESRSLAVMSVACGTADSVTYAASDDLSADAVFDLASLSKLYTALLAMRLSEEGLLDLSSPVTRYAPAFTALRDVTVEQILGFEVVLKTPQRIDEQPGAETAAQTLFAAAPAPDTTGRRYSDIHAMVMRYVIEGAAGRAMFDCLTDRVLAPLGLRETWCHVPEAVRSRCVSTDREHRIEGDRWFVREGIASGTVHDPKARVLAPEGEVFCGHAGLFATRGDVVRLCQAVLNEKIVSRSTLSRMAVNRTGTRRPDGSWTQFLGTLCYVKHPVQYHSEVPAYMSDQALALSGFTGNHLAVDPATGIFEFYLGSRVYNRLSTLIPPPGKQRTDYGLTPDGTGCVTWPGEGAVISSVDYVHLKDLHYHSAVAEVLGL